MAELSDKELHCVARMLQSEQLEENIQRICIEKYPGILDYADSYSLENQRKERKSNNVGLGIWNGGGRDS